MTSQSNLFDAAPDLFLPIGKTLEPSLDSSADLPPGPYRVSLIRDLETGGWSPPFVVRAANGRAVASHIASKAIADKVATAMNLAYPVEEELKS